MADTIIAVIETILKNKNRLKCVSFLENNIHLEFKPKENGELENSN